MATTLLNSDDLICRMSEMLRQDLSLYTEVTLVLTRGEPAHYTIKAELEIKEDGKPVEPPNRVFSEGKTCD